MGKIDQNSKIRKSNKDFIFLSKSKYVEKWIMNYSLSQQNSRMSILSRYIRFLLKKENPSEIEIIKKADQIILDHYEDTRKEPLEQTNIAKNQMKAFYEELVNQGRTSPNSARQYIYSKLASYFKRNNVPIIFQKNEIPKESENAKGDMAWRNKEGKMMNLNNLKEVLKKIRDSLKNTRDKAILLCKISSGMDDCDLFNVSIGQYRMGKMDDFNLCYIKGNRQKSETYFLTAFSSEAIAMIDLYLEEKSQKEGRELTDKDKLFTSLKINKKSGRYGKIRRNAFAENLREITKTLGYQNITPKQFRRFFKSHLERNGVNREMIEGMLGHTGFQYILKFKNGNEQGFIEDYHMKVEPYLLLGNGNHKAQQLKEEMEIIKQENENMREELTEVKNQMKDILKFIRDSKETNTKEEE
jgi:integrase